jgi:hypothetical protein
MKMRKNIRTELRSLKMRELNSRNGKLVESSFKKTIGPKRNEDGL